MTAHTNGAAPVLELKPRAAEAVSSKVPSSSASPSVRSSDTRPELKNDVPGGNPDATPASRVLVSTSPKSRSGEVRMPSWPGRRHARGERRRQPCTHG